MKKLNNLKIIIEYITELEKQGIEIIIENIAAEGKPKETSLKRNLPCHHYVEMPRTIRQSVVS